MTFGRGSVGGAAIAAGAVVAVLLAAGLSVTLTTDTDSVGRQLGLAVLSGGIVGGALVLVESLLQGAEGRRAAHESLVAALSSTSDLNGIDLAGRQLAQIYLPGRALVAARLARVNLEGAKLFFGDLRYADLRGANLAGADLSGATLAGADLTGANLTGAILRDVDMTAAVLTRCCVSGAVIAGARLIGTSFRASDLTGALVCASLLMGATFLEATLGMAHIENNQYDETTTWPAGFEPPESRDVAQATISSMDLASYLAYRAGRPDAAPLGGDLAHGDG